MTDEFDNINESLINYHTVQMCKTLFRYIENCQSVTYLSILWNIIKMNINNKRHNIQI